MNFTQRLDLLAERINPDLIIDVGVAYGTPTLYARWPSAYLALVEPNPEFHEYLEYNVIAEGRGSLFKYAASTCDREIQLDCKHDGSSLILESTSRSMPNQLSVRANTLDAIVQSLLYEKPRIVLKTDCQGHDYGALLGASNTLRYCDLVIAETHIYPWKGSEKNHLANIIEILNMHDFCLYDIVDPLYRPHDLALAQVDAVFVPRNSSLVAYQGF
jgi:FkbM family methyltransferase